MSKNGKVNKTTLKLDAQQQAFINFLKFHLDTAFAGALSTIAGQKNYQVKETTQFSLSPDCSELVAFEADKPKEDIVKTS